MREEKLPGVSLLIVFVSICLQVLGRGLSPRWKARNAGGFSAFWREPSQHFRAAETASVCCVAASRRASPEQLRS